MPHAKSEEAVAFGEAVREARKSLGLSQDDFAAVSDLHRTYIGGIERGERNPTLTTILRISAALQLKPETLIARVRTILCEGERS